MKIYISHIRICLKCTFKETFKQPISLKKILSSSNDHSSLGFLGQLMGIYSIERESSIYLVYTHKYVTSILHVIISKRERDLVCAIKKRTFCSVYWTQAAKKSSSIDKVSSGRE